MDLEVLMHLFTFPGTYKTRATLWHKHPYLFPLLQLCLVCFRMRMLVFGREWKHYYYAPSAMRRSLIPENCPAGISFALSAWIY